ncbi:hypothetical protein [Georhizobium sp. MAB10]|uniref:hypothetical protein n=1 Tax=Georhizobium sp. MAB10 TaxID=3028319 RepID=UPI0038560CCA
MNENFEIRAILTEMADRLDRAAQGDGRLQTHVSAEDRSARHIAFECRRAAGRLGKEPLIKEWVAFLLGASRTLADDQLKIDLVEFQERLAVYYGPFSEIDLAANQDLSIETVAHARYLGGEIENDFEHLDGKVRWAPTASQRSGEIR